MTISRIPGHALGDAHEQAAGKAAAGLRSLDAQSPSAGGGELFSVCQTLEGGFCEWVRLGVGAKEAVEAAHHYTHNVASKLGLVERVIIVDQDDFTVFLWVRGQGVTYPPEARGRQ